METSKRETNKRLHYASDDEPALYSSLKYDCYLLIHENNMETREADTLNTVLSFYTKHNFELACFTTAKIGEQQCATVSRNKSSHDLFIHI